MADIDERHPQPPEDRYQQQRLANVGPPAQGNPRPAPVYDLVVIGGGPAGLTAAEAAAGVGARVALVERKLLGGSSLNTACIPSKTLLRTTRLYGEMLDAPHYGAVVPGTMPVDFAAVMARVRRVRSRVSGDDSLVRLEAAGIDVFFGDAHFLDAESIGVGDDVLRFRKALVATGAAPAISPIPGLAEAGYLTSDTVFELTELPARLVVIGGGPLGCELAQAFCRLGVLTTIVQDPPLFLDGEERDAAQLLSDAFARDGIEVRLNTSAVRVRVVDGEKYVDLVSDDYSNTIAVDAILVGMGRAPNVQGLDLEKAGIELDATGGIRVDDELRSSNRRVYAAGDVCLERKFEHTAAASAKIAIGNALLGRHERLGDLVIPWCTFTDPEIAHVGLYVREANRDGIPIKTFTIPMHQVDRAIADGEDEGFVKIHVREGSDTILGATIVARHAGEMINEITLAMVSGLGLSKLAKVIHAYPTQADAIRQAADAYNRTRLTVRLRRRLIRSFGFHTSGEDSP
jgi:pyruvate/2-oxoglutarate dehydrogenase complex dihydrolipoamide dehydrogenase (E3) component